MTTRTSTFADEAIDTGSLSAESGQQHPLVEAGQEAGQSVGMIAERATHLGFQQADKAREGAADTLQQVTQTIRRVGTDLETDQPQIAGVVTTAADQAERIASYLRTTDAREILYTVEDMARRQPLIFLGGAFLLGAAVSRFIKAAGGGSSSQGSTGQWQQTGYGQDWTAADYQATGPGGTGMTGTNGLTADDRLAEGI
jgi:hypothetical protein